MPKLWTESVAGHRSAVRDAVLDATAGLVAEHGLVITMSQIAAQAGIGRATLYRHFPDIDAVLTAWHERQVTRHLQQLTDVRDNAEGSALDRLESVLTAYAGLSRHPGGSEGALRLHRAKHMEESRQRLHGLITDLIAAGARTGELRDDVPAAELASFAIGALSAAHDLDSGAAVRRLVGVTVAGLQARR